MKLLIRTETEALSDESVVYNVTLHGNGTHILLSCVSENDADLLVVKLTDAVNKHTVDMVELRS